MNASLKQSEKIYALLFGSFLCCLFVVGVVMMLSSFDNMILGTELNPNGSVEYLCLGRGCENLQAMDW